MATHALWETFERGFESYADVSWELEMESVFDLQAHVAAHRHLGFQK
jgi:hypothetical protein